MSQQRTIILDTAADIPACSPPADVLPPEVGLPLHLLTHMTILGYLKTKGLLANHPANTLSAHGKAVAKFSRLRGVPVGKVPDAKYGDVNAYAMTILDEYFASLGAK